MGYDNKINGADINPVFLFGKSREALMDQIYRDTTESLKGLILARSESVKKFCEETNINRYNLGKVFNGTYGKEMSVGLYIRCLIGLELISSDSVSGDSLLLNLSLRDYLRVDNNLIMQSIILIQH